MAIFTDIGRGFRGLLRIVGAPVRRARGRGDVVLQPFRGYGSRRHVFMIGRVFRQRSATPAGGRWDARRHLRDAFRRLVRRPVAGVEVRGEVFGAQAVAETDADGYFRLEWRLDAPAPDGPLWRSVTLRLGGEAPLEAAAEVYIPPDRARFVVISDIDDTVMRTGVANKLVMSWRLFAQGASSRTAFPGVASLYRALHAGASGDEGNPMLYVSRAPWGLYDLLEEFFHRHAIPNGPLLFLREWGVSWRSPLPRRAEDHKRVLIEAIMEVYRDLPVVLIGDSGQHDPEIYRAAVERCGDRVRAVYIRNVSKPGARILTEIEAMKTAVRNAGSELVLAPDTVAMAKHAAALGLIAPGAVAKVRARQPEGEAQG